MVEVFGSCAAVADVVGLHRRRTPRCEWTIPRQGRAARCRTVAPSFGAQDRHTRVGGLAPIRVEAVGPRRGRCTRRSSGNDSDGCRRAMSAWLGRGGSPRPSPCGLWTIAGAVHFGASVALSIHLSSGILMGALFPRGLRAGPAGGDTRTSALIAQFDSEWSRNPPVNERVVDAEWPRRVAGPAGPYPHVLDTLNSGIFLGEAR
jgi:hypothetical protein